MKVCLAIFALCAVACSSGAWRRVETPHFVLRTDFGSSQARRAGVALEATRDALVSAAWPKFNFKSEKIEVYLLANGVEFERYFGRKNWSESFRIPPRKIFLFGSLDRWQSTLLRRYPAPHGWTHEVAHDLSLEVWPNQPKWFYEGLADFLAAIYYADDGKRVVVGGLNSLAYRAYYDARTVNLDDAFAWGERPGPRGESENVGLHGLSWLFVHWLYNAHPQALRRYMGELALKTPPERALQLAVPELDLSTIDRDLFAYLEAHPRLNETIVPVRETPVNPSSLDESLLDAIAVRQVKDTLAEAAQRYTKEAEVRE